MSVRTMTWVWEHAPTEDATDQLVLLAIADCANDQGLDAYPSIPTIARKTRLAERTVYRAIDRLRASGVLEVSNTGPRGANRYRIVMRRDPCHAVTPDGESPLTESQATPDGESGHPCQGVRVNPDRESPDPSSTSRSVQDPSDVCAEPASGSTPVSPAVLDFVTVGTGASTWSLTADKLAEWTDAYPGLDVLAECRKARVWLDANPTKRKTARGMSAFLVRWLNMATDRRGGSRITKVLGGSYEDGADRNRGRTGAPQSDKYSHLVRRASTN